MIRPTWCLVIVTQISLNAIQKKTYGKCSIRKSSHYKRFIIKDSECFRLPDQDTILAANIFNAQLKKERKYMRNLNYVDEENKYYKT